MAASELPAETLDLLLIYKVVLFSIVIPRCPTVSRLIFPPSGQIFTSSFVPVSRLSALLPATHLHSHFSFFSCELLSEMGTFIITGGLCFLEAISRGVVSSCWWMLANRRCQTLCSLSFITSLKDVPLGILTRPLPPLHSLRKSLVILQQLCADTPSGDGARGLRVRGVTDHNNFSR